MTADALHDLSVLRAYRDARANTGPIETTRNVALNPKPTPPGWVHDSLGGTWTTGQGPAPDGKLARWLCHAYGCDEACVELGIVAHGTRGPWSSSFGATLTWEGDEEAGIGDTEVGVGGHASGLTLLGIVRDLQGELEGELDLECVSPRRMK